MFQIFIRSVSTNSFHAMCGVRLKFGQVADISLQAGNLCKVRLAFRMCEMQGFSSSESQPDGGVAQGYLLWKPVLLETVFGQNLEEIVPLVDYQAQISNSVCEVNKKILKIYC